MLFVLSLQLFDDDLLLLDHIFETELIQKVLLWVFLSFLDELHWDSRLVTGLIRFDNNKII